MQTPPIVSSQEWGAAYLLRAARPGPERVQATVDRDPVKPGLPEWIGRSVLAAAGVSTAMTTATKGEPKWEGSS